MSGKAVYELSENEIEILRAGIDDPDIATNYFFRQPNSGSGWLFDFGFEEIGKWQKKIHQAAQKRIVVLGGFGSGKTKGVALSASLWCILTRDFKFMNCAPASWQSELMYKFVMDTLARDTVFGEMIYEHPKRPYPTIDIRFRVRGNLIRSTEEFMSVDKNAKAILSWEGDWVNIDEAGLIDDLEGTIINLGSRMRGHINGRPYLGRMSMCSNSWDNPELWYRYDLARELPTDYLTLTISSRHNKNITPDQLRMMLRDIPESEHERFIDAARPEGRGNYFSKSKIYACENENFGNFIVGNFNSGVEGFQIENTTGCGVTYYQIPAGNGHTYMLVGDPGTGNAPNRNAPVLMVWDVTEFPSLNATLAAFYWGTGEGSITPFYRMLFRFMQAFNPVGTYVDNTGPQRNTSELLNNYLMSTRQDRTKALDFLGETFDLSKVYNPMVQGMDFSGGRKPAYLVAGRMMLEATLFSWPKIITGMRSQLSNYDLEKDNTSGTKIPQDLVATYCMSAFAVQSWFRIDPTKLGPKKPEEGVALAEAHSGREARLPTNARDRGESAYADEARKVRQQRREELERKTQ